MVQNKVITVSEGIDEKGAANLDQALTEAGFGIYNIKYSFVLTIFLIGSITEPLGYSYVLPSAKCDLDMSDTIKGFLGSVPYIGIVLTSFPWGYLVDTRGRKMTIIYSAFAVWAFSVASAFMPNLISFTIFKFLASLCIACPAAVPYTYVGELTPVKYRDVMLLAINAVQTCGTALIPLLAWATLPLQFEVDFGLYSFKPWRLLVIVNASLFPIGALLLLWGPESPKYLMAQGRHDESLQVLKTIYAKNKGKSPDDFPIKKLILTETTRNFNISFLKSLKEQSLPLLYPPHLKWMILNSILMFGIYSTLNGLGMWVPDILNRVFSGTAEGTACDVISQGKNETAIDGGVCMDTIDNVTFLVNTVGNASSGIIAIIITGVIQFIGKKVLLVTVFCTIGVFSMLINFTKQQMLFAVLISSSSLMTLGKGPVNAYTVQLFPTYLRGMAMGLTLMAGRLGSGVGSNVAVALLNTNCEATFYLFGGILLFCGMLSFLLPKSEKRLY